MGVAVHGGGVESCVREPLWHVSCHSDHSHDSHHDSHYSVQEMVAYPSLSSRLGCRFCREAICGGKTREKKESN